MGAAKRLPTKTSYKLGHKAHPNSGRPKISDGETLLSKELFSVDMLNTFIEVLNMPIGDFQKEETNVSQPAYRALFVSAINNGIQTGDLKVMEHVMNRIMGKVKDVVKMETDKPTEAQEYEAVKLELLGLISQGLQ